MRAAALLLVAALACTREAVSREEWVAALDATAGDLAAAADPAACARARAALADRRDVLHASPDPPLRDGVRPLLLAIDAYYRACEDGAPAAPELRRRAGDLLRDLRVGG